MSNSEREDEEREPKQYDWRSYETPTKNAAKILEDLVADDSPKSKGSNTSSSGSFIVLNPQNEGNDRSPSTPLPLYPPTCHPESAPPPRTPTRPSTVGKDDVTNTPDRSSKSHKSKESFNSGLPRRLMEELKHIHDRRDSATGSSPTDSHPGRHHPSHHPRGNGRSRSSSESLSSLLVVTTERLSRETARANDAERKAAEIMSLFKNTHEAKTKLERDLNRVKQELELYKIQLDVAQKEIFRAQEIVDRVERERTSAKEEAARARDKIHKLNEVRAIEHAMEEGRRLGFEEGLKQGRYVQPAREVFHDAPRTRHKRDENDRVSRYTYPDQYSDGSGSSGVSHRHRRSSRPPAPAQSERSISKAPPPRAETVASTQPGRGISAGPPAVHQHGTPPDVGSFGKLLPRPMVTTPMPVNVPSTQPQPPPAMPPHQSSSTIHDHSVHPEKIAVQPSTRDRNGPIHPIPVWNRSPSVMHERIVLPPDNFIPTMDANSVISLPPPHELSRPVPPEAPPLQNNVPDYSSYRPRSRSRGPERRSLKLVDHDERETIKTKDYAYSQAPKERDDASSFAYSALSDGRDRSRKYATMRSRATSILSPGSTHLSDLDLLSPPRNDSERGRRHEEVETTAYRRNPNKDTPSPTQRMAEEWRSANREYITPPSQNVEPMRPSSAAAYTLTRPPRRPREIVMPAPLADVFMNTTKSPRAGEQPLPGRSTPPHALRTQSTNTIPGIEVVTPSTHASSRLSAGTVVDPVLLTPESANRPHPLPDSITPERDHQGHEQMSMLLPNNNFPEGFVPLSPIPGMGNLNPYPPGFAPSLPKDHQDAMSPDFKYPSSPLMRSN